MSQFDYTKTAATAQRLLERFGAGVTVRRTTTGARDPEVGKPTTTTDTWTATAVRGEPYTVKEQDGTLIKAGDLRLLMSAARDLEPGDKVTFEAEVWTVISTNPVRPATVTVLYMPQVRK